MDNTPIGQLIPREGKFSILESAILKTSNIDAKHIKCNTLEYNHASLVTTNCQTFTRDFVVTNLYIKKVIGYLCGSIKDDKLIVTETFNGYIYSNGILKVVNNKINVICGELKDINNEMIEIIDYHLLDFGLPKKLYAKSNSILPNAEIIFLSGSGGVVMLGTPCEGIKTIIGKDIVSPILIKELSMYISDKQIVKLIYDDGWINIS